MNDVQTHNKGNIVIGGTLVLTGLAIILERTGVLHWSDQWTLWPLILGGIGLARLLQSIPGEPKQGLLFLTAAAWLLSVEAGWVSLENSWPIVVIVFGLIVALNGGTRRRWQRPTSLAGPADPARPRRPERPTYPLSPLAVLGIWIAVVAGQQVSGIRPSSQVEAGDRVHVVSVMGRSGHISRATAFDGADVTTVIGRSVLDLREATVAPGVDPVVQVVLGMGTIIVRVPETWTVDTGAISAIGSVRDERPAPAEPDASVGPAPRLVLRGVVLMGTLRVTS